jgi:hypothetical protein
VVQREKEGQKNSEMKSLRLKRREGGFIYGVIVDYEASKTKGIHLVSEYSLEKVEKQNIEHQLLGGIVWDSPWNMEFDAATFWGLNSDSID